MDFSLTEEQKMLRDMVKKFADTEIKPYAQQIDEEDKHPEEICKKMSELKLMGIYVPEEYGGGGLDKVSFALAAIEVAKASAAVSVILCVNNSLYCFPVLTWGTEEQKKKFLPPVAGGPYHGCYGLTEPEAGSDAANLKTTATLVGDSWIINGSKRFITNGNIAKYMVFAAMTDKSKGYKGISQFVIDLDETPGFSVGKLEHKMGIRGSGTAEMIFENAKIPKDSILGDPGAGFRQMLTTLDGGRIGIGAQAVGIGWAILEESVNYARERVQFGKPISSFQAIQFKLADMATQIEAAELLVLKAAYLQDNNMPFEKEAAMAKMFASDVVMQAAIEGVQIFGGYGYCKEYPMERFMRDVKITQIYEGTNEIMRIIISRHLLGLRK